jgi:hypothetical protein
MNRGEKDTEQRHQQVDLHGVLRCIPMVQIRPFSDTGPNTKAFFRFNDTLVITNG